MHQCGSGETGRREVPRQRAEWVAQFSAAEEVLTATGQSMEFTESRPLGGTWALDALWTRLGVAASARRLLAGRGIAESAERVLFALVANRALATSSVPPAGQWASEDVFISGLPGTTENACCQAADWLLEIGEALEREIFDRVGTILNRDTGPVFFGVTAAWFDGGQGIRGRAGDDDRGPAWLQTYGKHADHGEYPPRAVIGIAVTRDGIPVRTWCWERPAAEQELIREVKDDLRDWGSPRIISVRGQGSTTAESRRYLRESGNYVIAEKLRSGSAEADAAVSRQGRYQDVAANLRVKEVRLGDDERSIICHNPGRAVREAEIRARTLARLTEFIKYTDTLSKDKRAEARALIAARPGLNRYVRVTSDGRLRIRAKSVKAEENLDGKYLLCASDSEMTAEDIAMGYTRLLEIEDSLAAMNELVELRSACHCAQRRIHAHVLLCWLALLLARVAENACRAGWPTLRRELDRIAIGTFTGPVGTFHQRTEITDAQRAIFAQLGIDPPPLMPQRVM